MIGVAIAFLSLRRLCPSLRRNILILNMPVIQVDIIELYLFNRYNQRRDFYH